MSIKVYPVIYSRTKNVDYVPDFLARPADLDFREANKFVSFAMYGLDLEKSPDADSNKFVEFARDELNSGKRYAVFSAGNYCIAGTACMTNELAQSGDKEYTRDKFGRNIIAFIGIAVNKGRTTDIPLLSDEKYWEIYLKYIKKQWDEPAAQSEKCSEPEIELETITPNSYKPATEVQLGKNIITEFDYNSKSQEIFNYYFAENLKIGSSCSFVSREIKSSNDLNKSPFNCIVLNDYKIKTFKDEDDRIKEEERKKAQEERLNKKMQSQSSGNNDMSDGNENYKLDDISEGLKKYIPAIVPILIGIVIITCLGKCNNSTDRTSCKPEYEENKKQQCHNDKKESEELVTLLKKENESNKVSLWEKITTKIFDFLFNRVNKSVTAEDMQQVMNTLKDKTIQFDLPKLSEKFVLTIKENK